MPTQLLPLTKSPAKAKAKAPPYYAGGDASSPRKQRQMLKSSEVRHPVEFSAGDVVSVLPGSYADGGSNGTGTLHDILLFDQKLRDATAMDVHADASQWTNWDVARADQDGHAPVDTSALNLLTSNKLTFEILTSDRGQRVVPALIEAWGQDKFSDNGNRLWTILDTFFRSLPYVFVHRDELHTKLIVRYMSAMALLKNVLMDALFCPNASVAAAVTASIAPAHKEKIPLYHYCHQLEREIHMLKNSTADQSWEMIHASDVGLLQDATARLLLEYWKLPKRERLAFLAQVFTHTSEMEVEIVQVLLENSTFVLRRVLEEMGYESKEERHERRLHSITSLVTKSVTASLEAKKLRLQNEAKRKELEPIQLRHKGIQVCMDDEAPQVRTPPHTPKESLYSPRRFVANREKSLQLVLMQDYQPFKKDKPSVLVKDLWTISALTDNLIHHLSVFVDNANEKHTVPPQVVSMGTLLLEWLRFEKVRAVSNAKEAGHELHCNPHYKQCMLSMLQLFLDHDQAPLSVKTQAQTLQDYILNQRQPASVSVPRDDDGLPLHAVAVDVHPSDVRNFLKGGFPADIAQHMVTIASDTSPLEKQSHLILLMEQLERYTRESMHKPGARPLGFGEVRPVSSEASVGILLEKIKGLILSATDANREELGRDAAALLLTYTGRKQSTLASGHVRALDAESVCHVLLTKLEHEMQAGPLAHTTRRELTRLNSLVSTFVHIDETDPKEALLSPEHIQDSVSWLGALLAQALLQKDSLGKATGAVLDALHSMLGKTQDKMKGASVTACLATIVNAMKLSGDKKALEDFVRGLDDLQATLKALLNPLSVSVDEESWSMTEAAIDAVVADPRVDAIPVLLVQLGSKLQELQTARVAAANKPQPPPKGRPNALLPGLGPWEKETTKGRKPHVLGITTAELSEMFSENKTIMNLGTVLKLIYQAFPLIYRERHECNLSEQDSVGSTAFIDFVYDWYLRKYGLRKLAMQHLSKLLLALKKHKKTSKKCLLVYVPYYDYSSLNFALGLLHLWTNGTFSIGASPTIKAPLTTLMQTLEDSYDKRFGPFGNMDGIKSTLAAKACLEDATLIDQDVALEVAIEEFGVMKTTVEKMLREIYAAGDFLGQDEMGYDEFATVLHGLSPGIADRDVVRMFREAADPVVGTIPGRRFVAVVIDQGVLSARQNKFKASTVAASSAAFPEYEEEQFAALDEAWQAVEADILAAVERIPHKEAASSLMLRVRILKMIITKRIDSETAWLAHRSILRDVSRFRNLSEPAIAAIKTKEAAFKEAVARLTSMKFGGLRLNAPSAMAYVTDLDENNLPEELHEGAEPEAVSHLEEKLRDEILRLTDGAGATDATIESTLDSYGSAVQKVRRVNEKYSSILRRVTIAIKALTTAPTDPA
ncbi:hypothetical protein ACHHYP_06899 [Achlya hypogyna]|uniref:Uncharacterized protein n=1 Tax=Achlya hypogyna TaxID=1202772 RepID=A0A1V9ZMZ6_ACHHY|nr:hypothetical protein ACHHYP_06899 [Achlya hypogyna]